MRSVQHVEIIAHILKKVLGEVICPKAFVRGHCNHGLPHSCHSSERFATLCNQVHRPASNILDTHLGAIYNPHWFTRITSSRTHLHATANCPQSRISLVKLSIVHFMMFSTRIFALGLLLALCLVPQSASASRRGCACKSGGRAEAIGKNPWQACKIAMMKCPTVSSCRTGRVCKETPRCSIGKKNILPFLKTETKPVWRLRYGKKIRVIIPVKRKHYKCRITCRPKGMSVCVKPGGRGDPHLNGFDGKIFDFHGVHGKYYAFFGRHKGDMLVTRIRSAKRWAHTGVEKTYFDQFGLNTFGSNDHVSISLVEDGDKSGVWNAELKLNDEIVDHDVSFGSTQIKKDMDDGSISIRTAETEYVFRPKYLDVAARRHLDVEIGLVGTPQTTESYVGVLGVTLNHALGKEIAAELDTSERDAEFENVLRGRFEVSSLFPNIADDVDHLSGVVRGLAVHKSVVSEVKSWKAMSQLD